jgi:maltooligosyltrehalose trehalohydrolase
VVEEEARGPDIGALPAGKEGVHFRVWAPMAETVSVRILSGSTSRRVQLDAGDRGYFDGVTKGAGAGDRYFFILNGETDRPDPASRFQPEGVHGPSQIVDPGEFEWHDDGWKGTALRDLVIYELHVGTFTRKGTFGAVIDHLAYLTDLGVTAIEIMPVGQFPGGRNWGYDGVYPFAPQNTYGGPNRFKELIDACHRTGLAVILDVVYNHLGPEGNYLGCFGPYFTDRYKTPWGEAINFDGPCSDEVRHYFVANTLYWIDEYHVDALRVDAIHGMFDFGARHFLRELSDAVNPLRKALGREIHLIAESDLNDVRVISEPEIGGYGIDAQWNDDFHHALHGLITGESHGYYADFGDVSHLAKAYSEGFVYSGQYSHYRNRRHGSPSRDKPPFQFIVFSQNHDQVGNGAGSERLSGVLPLDKLKLAAAAVLLSPFVPLLFMGEEYGERSPFQYFVSYGDKELVEAVRRGRQQQLAAKRHEESADPQDEVSFLNSIIDVKADKSPDQAALIRFYRELILLRKANPLLGCAPRDHIEVKSFDNKKALAVRRWSDSAGFLCLYSFNDGIVVVGLSLPKGRWDKIIDSSAGTWGGHASPSPDRLVSHGQVCKLELNPNSIVIYHTDGERRKHHSHSGMHDGPDQQIWIEG